MRSRMMASTTMASPASSPRSMLREPSARLISGAEAAGADQGREHHHRQRQHDALGQAGHDGRQRRGQLHLPQQLALGGAEGLAGLDDAASAPR